MISKMRVRVCIFDTCVNEEEAAGLRNEDRNRLALLRGHEKAYIIGLNIYISFSKKFGQSENNTLFSSKSKLDE